MGKWQQAYDDYSRILEQHPAFIHFCPERCQAAFELGHVDQALADANRLVDLAEQYPRQADSLVWNFLAQRQVGRFPAASLALSQRAFERNPANVYRAELGGVLFYLARYREAVENLLPNALEGPSEASAMAGFYLVMSHYHLGENAEARKAPAPRHPQLEADSAAPARTRRVAAFPVAGGSDAAGGCCQH